MSSALRHTILYIYALLLCLAFYGAAEAQSVLPGSCTQKTRHIRTVQLGVNGDFERLPVIALGIGDRLTLACDALTHYYRRYPYTVERCNADGKPIPFKFDKKAGTLSLDLSCIGVLKADEPDFIVEIVVK